MEKDITSIESGPRKRTENIERIQALADSIESIGLLHPITITENGHLVAGYHRLEACKALGWTKIDVNVVNLEDLDVELAEIDENLIRYDLTELEKSQHLKRRKEIYEARHPETKHGGDRRSEKAKSSRQDGESKKKRFTQDTKEKTALSERTVQRAISRAEKIAPDVQETIADHPIADSGVDLDALAKLEPEKQLKVVEEVMNGKAKDIRHAYRIVRDIELRDAAANREIDTSSGLYSVIYADPPWRYEHAISDSREIENQYPTLTLEEIKEFDIPAEDNAVLFLWATSPKLAEALGVIESWNFIYRTCLVWVKDKIGLGYWARQRHELLLIAIRGKFPTPFPENRPDSVVEAPRLGHSEKPKEVYEIIRQMTPNFRRLEVFSRSKAEGFDAVGFEAE